MKKINKFLSVVLAALMILSSFSVVAFAADDTSSTHTVTLTPSATTVKAGDTVTVTVGLDKSEGICAIGYKLAFDSKAFVLNTGRNEEYWDENEVAIPASADVEWFDGYGALKAAAKWGEITFGSQSDEGYNAVIFGVAKATGISATQSKENMEIGKYSVTVAENAPAGTYQIYLLSDSTTTDAGKSFGAPIKCEPITITVEGEAPVEPEVPADTSSTHTVTLTPSATTVKAGDTVTVTVGLDKSEGICAIGYKLAFDSKAFVLNTGRNEEYWDENEVAIPASADVEWFDGYGALKAAAKWGEITFGSQSDEGYNAVIFGVAKATGISATQSKENMEIGKYSVTVAENAPAGTYQIYLLSDSTTTDAGKSFGAPIKCEPITITVEGAPAPDPVMSGITVTANAVEIADADKADEAKIIAAVKAAITAIKAQWTEGKEDTDVAVADVTITVDTAATKATVAYNGFTAEVTYTVAAPIPVMTGITVAANAVEIADADKADTAKIEAAIKAAITSIKAQWTEGKADTDVAVADVTITIDTAATKATIAYEGFTADVAYTVAAPVEPEVPADTSSTHTVTLTPSATTVKAGDTVTVTVGLDKSEGICAIGYKLAFDSNAFVLNTGRNEEYWDENEVAIPASADVEWFDGYGALKAAAKWGEITFGSQSGEGYNAVIFGVAKATGISATQSKENMEIGKYSVTVAENAPAGTYQIYLLSDSTTTDAGKSFGAPIKCEPITITVEGAPAPEPVMSGITAVADGVEIAYADKDNADVIKAAIANALTVKAQWTEGKADTDVAVADVEITVDTAATKATVAYNGFTAEVTYTVAAKPVVYFKVTFKAEGAEDIVIEVEEGKAIGDALAADATKEGFEFAGWFDADDNEIDAETIVNGNIVATAKFQRIVGDVNCDGVKDSKDAIYLLNHCALPDLYPVDGYEYALDMNGDGVVSSLDAIYLLNSIAIPALYSLAW